MRYHEQLGPATGFRPFAWVPMVMQGVLLTMAAVQAYTVVVQRSAPGRQRMSDTRGERGFSWLRRRLTRIPGPRLFNTLFFVLTFVVLASMLVRGFGHAAASLDTDIHAALRAFLTGYGHCILSVVAQSLESFRQSPCYAVEDGRRVVTNRSFRRRHASQDQRIARCRGGKTRSFKSDHSIGHSRLDHQFAHHGYSKYFVQSVAK